MFSNLSIIETYNLAAKNIINAQDRVYITKGKIIWAKAINKSIILEDYVIDHLAFFMSCSNEII